MDFFTKYIVSKWYGSVFVAYVSMTVQANSKNKAAGAKKVSNDEFMAAAIGDVQWLKQSLKERKGEISFDKNVRFMNFFLFKIRILIVTKI